MRLISWSVMVIVLLVYVVVNAVASQDFPRLFYALTTRNDIVDAQRFLQYVAGTEWHPPQFEYWNRVYNNGLVQNEAVQREESALGKEKYRAVLMRNPQSRDALVVLALYELKAGNKDEAGKYYTQAKEVDPWIRIDSLEGL